MSEPTLNVPYSGYYVYTLARPSDRVFYVGKGSQRRVFGHEKEALAGCECYKCDVIRKIWRQGGEVKKAIVYTCRREVDAFAKEAEYIRLHGLTNLTNVLPGFSGFLAPSQSSVPARNEVAYLARLRRAGIRGAQLRSRMEDWHEKKIERFTRQRRYAVVVGDDALRDFIDSQIEGHKVMLGDVFQLSFDETL